MNLYRNTLEPDPRLEALRTKALKENSSDKNDWIYRLIRRTAPIHAGYLFEDLKTLQNLCIYIGESQNKITDSGWEKFGYYLGLNPSLLKVLHHNNFNNEDPCYNILLAYVQYENASIGKVLDALLRIGRFDVISRIKHSINVLADAVLNNNTNFCNNLLEDTSDYESLPASEGSSHSSESNFSSPSDVLLCPKHIPPAPFIFQNLKSNVVINTQKINETYSKNILLESPIKYGEKRGKNNDEANLTNELDVKNSCNLQLMKETSQLTRVRLNKEIHNSPKKTKYGVKVFLTFAEDGIIFAEKIAKKFRGRKVNNSSIGVLILSEHIEKVSMDPLQFIEGAFYQVDYICPILTPGYYNLITKKEKTKLMSSSNIDVSYVPYIYRLMNSYFVMNDCLNDKVRCIIPENAFLCVPYNFLLTNPIFGAWVNISEVDDLAERMVKTKSKNCKVVL